LVNNLRAEKFCEIHRRAAENTEKIPASSLPVALRKMGFVRIYPLMFWKKGLYLIGINA